MIDGEDVFGQPVKNYLRTFENIREIATGQGNDYKTSFLLEYNYFKDNYSVWILLYRVYWFYIKR